MINIQDFLKTIPKKPGVYQYFNQKGEIIYVGKAKNLQNRIKSYFQKNSDHSPKTKILVKNITDIKYIIVNSELEAILLETNLIKEHLPKYNVLMKDDKNFIYLKITTQDEYPKIYLTRRIENDKATYLGPKTSAYDIKTMLKTIESLIPYPNCQFNIINLKTQSRTPNQNKQSLCIIKNIDKSHSPCFSELNQYEYHTLIKQIIQHFKGNSQELIKDLENKMQTLAKQHNFEQAAKLRDKLQAIQKIIEKQSISNSDPKENIDVFGYSKYAQTICVSVFQIRQGKIINQNRFSLKNPLETNTKEVMQEIIIQYYQCNHNLPKEILIPEMPDTKQDISKNLESIYKQKIKINKPIKGRKAKLVSLALKNAESYLKQQQVKWLSQDARKNTLLKIKEMLDLKQIPNRIECYDISHLQGQNTKGSMVVFKKGTPTKDHYRIFNIKSLENNQIDDYQSIQEVLFRRLKYLASPEKGLKTSNKDSIFSIKRKKETLAEITYTQLTKDQYEINTIIQIDQSFLQEFIWKKFIQKLKPKKIYLKNKIDSALNIGFKAIKHDIYNYAYYHNTNKTDLSLNSLPGLIVIDGGKGQLNAAKKALKKLNLDIPIISISKRLETIHIANNKAIQLDKNNTALNLIQQVRDEAHRFAISNNRKARIKKLTQ